MKPLAVTSGEPAGIGPDICLALASLAYPLVILGDKHLLSQRASRLNYPVNFIDYQPGVTTSGKPGELLVLSINCPEEVFPGLLNEKNASYVLNLLDRAISGCEQGEFSGLVTAPLHKAIINQSGIKFSGHTEYLAQKCQSRKVVMLLVCPELKVALQTTHLPLKDVSGAISKEDLIETLTLLYQGLQRDFGIKKPIIRVAGLNPHAGESGYLGNEEIEVIAPALDHLRAQGMKIIGPMSADTMFIKDPNHPCDAYLAMYHDQGLPVLKYAGFNRAVNVTLGLPWIRTSVDHGTALDLAATGKAEAGSLIAAVELAMTLANNREKQA